MVDSHLSFKDEVQRVYHFPKSRYSSVAGLELAAKPALAHCLCLCPPARAATSSGLPNRRLYRAVPVRKPGFREIFSPAPGINSSAFCYMELSDSSPGAQAVGLTWSDYFDLSVDRHSHTYL